eukprot:TRINITY_DN24727_c0_g1_i1.p1 TRINITY_DN24727_c0_g1~~TRINITY_DN24727_c0_g1_i1.p1  ORF type:complete len:206 (+),score=42.82 TRINITY_DN24727_c0_g1_i1:36-620(+)
MEFLTVLAALFIMGHVTNYNVTAHWEYNSRGFTKFFNGNRRRAAYFYAAFIFASSLIRDYVVDEALKTTNPVTVTPNFFDYIASIVGFSLFAFGIFLNFWTLKSLGIIGMYNGDSFGFLFDHIITDGPFQYLSDPQYVGATIATFGWSLAVYTYNWRGYFFTLVMALTYVVSVKFVEGPHMARIYSARNNNKKR